MILSSIGLALVEYVLIAYAGYATFGEAVDADILRSYPASPVVAAGYL